ncbi:MAG: nucleotidyltransferase substrate binding protein [Prevotellaceae bacterium]|jgi:nucleotidyltransferase substrate binding protein (TIGR01987 family)|nr:nucleotidyltransferase substrate binding protein [Prevotellaceae bacterium]
MTGQSQDIRWKQRFSNYQKALTQLRKFFEKKTLNELEQQGLIQVFEYTYELAWNVMKDYLVYEQADVTIMGSRDAIRRALQRGLIGDGHDWMAMISSRINSVHTYNEAIAQDIVSKIIHTYFRLFEQFEKKMEGLL